MIRKSDSYRPGLADPTLDAVLRRNRRSWVALLAAFVLVVQSLAGALATGAHAASVQLDAFGGVICTTDAAPSPSGGDESPEKRHTPSCCLAGCLSFAWAALPARAATPLPPLLVRRSDPVVPQRADHRPTERRGSPANPRAPPSIA